MGVNGEGVWGGHGGAEIVVTSVASPATMRFLRSGQVFVPVAVRNAEGARGSDATPGICWTGKGVPPFLPEPDRAFGRVSHFEL